MAATLNHVWYANFGDGASTGYYAVAAWVANAAKTAGQLVRQLTTPAVGSERVFVCIVAGTTAAVTEPTWVVNKGTKTPAAGQDGTVTWMECTGQPAVNGDVTNTPASSTERSQAIALGLIIKNNTALQFFICTGAGTCGAGEPTYNTTAGQTTTDSGVTWTCLGNVGSFALWNAPHARISNAIASTWAAAGDTVYVSAAYAETASVSITIDTGTNNSSIQTKIICVSNAASSPPVAADVTTGATVSVTGTGGQMNLRGTVFFQGIAFTCGSSSSSQTLGVAATSGNFVRFKNCALILGGTGPGQTLGLGNTNSRSKIVMENTTVQFGGSTSAAMELHAAIIWRDTPSALSKTGTNWPTTLWASAGNTGGAMLFENLDLSAFAGTNLMGASSVGSWRMVLSHCTLPAVTFAATASLSGPSCGQTDIINCDTAGVTIRHERWWYEGTQTVDTTALRTSGASDGTTPYSWKVVVSANATWLDPFECIPIAIWNTTVNPNNLTVTLEGAYNGAALPNNDEIWLDVSYFGTASSTLGTTKSETKATILTAAGPLGASSALWSGAARQNTHGYVVGDEIGVSSSGSVVRLFICTTPGTSLGSTPVAYGSATDGTLVTDGTAVFRAVMRFQLTLTLSTPQPQSVGYLTCYVKAALASATYWVDPYVTLT